MDVLMNMCFWGRIFHCASRSCLRKPRDYCPPMSLQGRIFETHAGRDHVSRTCTPYNEDSRSTTRSMNYPIYIKIMKR